MRIVARQARIALLSAALAGAVCLALAGGAGARQAPIGGKLSKRGYTVIAMAANGAARSYLAANGHFKLRPPAKRVTLQLRAPDGTYAGPIVIARERKGKRAILGVLAGTSLGKVKVKGGKGYGKVVRRIGSTHIDPSRFARARAGVPIGAGDLGRVRSKKTKQGAPGDTDLDGVPDSLDVDDDGDLILDEYDRSTKRWRSHPASHSIVGGTFPGGGHLEVITDLGGSGGVSASAANVNGGSTEAQIAAVQQEHGRLGIGWQGLDPGSGELNCGTLVYCSRGGTGRLQATLDPTSPNYTRAGSPPFPECCDANGNGFGSLVQATDPVPGSVEFDSNSGAMSLFHGATTAQLHAGDVLIERGTIDGAAQESAATVGFVFATLPVLASYDDGQGDSATLSYPHADAPLPVRAGPDGRIVLRLAFWRPQRPRIGDEAATADQWVDVGHLAYTAEANLAMFRSPGGGCPQSSYSAVDPSLSALPSSPFFSGPPTLGAVRFADLSGDQPSNPANTLSFTLDVSECLAAKGEAPTTSIPLQLGIWAFAIADNGSGGEKLEAMANSSAQFTLQP